MAEAVQALWPGTQVTIGPVIENGFYYDFRAQPAVHPRRPARDREEDARDHRARHDPSPRKSGRATRPSRCSATRARTSRSSWSTPSRKTRTLKIYKQGDWFDLCRGPHMTSTGKIGNAFKLMKVAGAYWRGDSNRADADAHLRHRLRQAGRARRLSQHAWKRPRSATIASSAARWTSSTSRRKGPAPCSGIGKGWTMFQEIVAYMRRRLKGDYQEVNAPQLLDKSLWETSGHWGWFRENMFHGEVGRRRDRGRARLRHQADELPRPYPDLQARAASRIATCRSAWPSSASCTATSPPARCTA